MKTARKPKTPKPLESVIQKDIVQTLKRLGIEVHRRNVAAMTGEYKGKRRFIKSGEKGQSDLWGVIPAKDPVYSRHFELEVKRPGERPNLNQTLWLLKMNQLTGSAFWADSPVIAASVIGALQRGGRVVYKGGTQRCEGADIPNTDFDVET